MVSERLRGVRGRIDFRRSLRHQLFERGQAHCEYQQFAVNAPRNQIIKSTLARLVSIGDFGPGHSDSARALRHRLRALVRDLDGVSLVELSPQLIRRQQLGRNDRDYELMLNVCLFLLESSLLTEYEGTGAAPRLDRSTLTLHQVFEEFVAEFYRYHLPAWKVTAQAHLAWPTLEPVARMPGMIADLVMVTPAGERVVLDTKFTAGSLTSKYAGGAPKYHSEHLYQLYSYLRTQEDLSPSHASASGVLLYPLVRDELSEGFSVQGHEMRVESVDLAADWSAVEAGLLSVVKRDEQEPPG